MDEEHKEEIEKEKFEEIEEVPRINITPKEDIKGSTIDSTPEENKSLESETSEGEQEDDYWENGEEKEEIKPLDLLIEFTVFLKILDERIFKKKMIKDKIKELELLQDKLIKLNLDKELGK